MTRIMVRRLLLGSVPLLSAVVFCLSCHDSGSTKGVMPMSPTGGDAAPARAGSVDSAKVPPTVGLMGPPNCGLPSAAFCDGFDAPSKVRGRAGDLDPTRWSLSRLMPQGPMDNGAAFPVGAAVLPKCRDGSPTLAWPPNDTVVCDPQPNVKNPHLLVGVASQNYGINSYRIRQPFDFAGRTGKIVFDAQGYATLGWISLALTDEPIGVPSYALYVNDEGGVLPKNGFEIHFSQTCGQGGTPTVFNWRHFHEFKDYTDTVQMQSGFDCPSAKKGRMNHFEITVAQDKVEVFASPFSEDGVMFAAPKLVLSTAVSLPFTRGYVHLSTHNHASLKYSTGTWAGNQGETDLNAWTAVWDNVGFDGVIVTDTREYEAPDSLTESTLDLGDPHNSSKKALNIGYVVPDVAMGASSPLKFTGVDLGGAKSAQVVLTSWYPNADGKISDVVLRYRFNGGTWRGRKVSPAEAALYTRPVVKGVGARPAILNAIAQTIDVELADLIAGDNTLEFATRNSKLGPPVGVANVDLILRTK